MIVTEEEVVEMLRQAVEKAGSQIAFCRETELSPSYVNQVLTGKTPPGEKLARALGITMRRNFYRIVDVVVLILVMTTSTLAADRDLSTVITLPPACFDDLVNTVIRSPYYQALINETSSELSKTLKESIRSAIQDAVLQVDPACAGVSIPTGAATFKRQDERRAKDSK